MTDSTATIQGLRDRLTGMLADWGAELAAVLKELEEKRARVAELEQLAKDDPVYEEFLADARKAERAARGSPKTCATLAPERRPFSPTVSTPTFTSRDGRGTSTTNRRPAMGRSRTTAPSTRTITRRIPDAARPSTMPYETWYGAGLSITGGAGGWAGGEAAITGEP